MESTIEPVGARAEALHRGPPLIVVAAVHAALVIVGLVISAAMGGAFPSPFAPRGPSDAWFAAQAPAVRALAFFQLGAAIPLAVFTATVASRLLFLGMRVAGVHIALAVLTSVVPFAAGLLLLARFAGFAWMICLGALLPKGSPGL